MTKTEKETLKIRETLSELIGEVTAKSLFASYGLFHQKIMFGLYQNNVFYLKAEGKLALFLESKGAASYLAKQPPSTLNISSYYRLPKEITSNKDLYKQILEQSLQQIRSQKLAEALAKKNRIKELPNLSIKHERMLEKVAVYNVDMFQTLGAKNAYIRLKKKGITADIGIFWAFYAALENKNINLITATEKQNVLARLNLALAEAGLRQVK
ncbi:TfoX/Sxy family DNA transformation protein [Pasteurella oralis]|uniref:TfoX/Sxy family DNA transformation protein n=1 Tax=Pasteurella oralis TaxID=1071947 RepID=A0ABW4NUM5_9PAST|nr:TfoX/Sxy family DNA transformation protein [Pasteurella oralis]MDO5055084.1 TfoX/Sxy family DNA transformation protein [Pasteurella oralis]